MIYKIVWVKLYRPEDNDFVWKPIRYANLWNNKIHDIEYRSKPPKNAIRIDDGIEQINRLKND